MLHNKINIVLMCKCHYITALFVSTSKCLGHHMLFSSLAHLIPYIRTMLWLLFSVACFLICFGDNFTICMFRLYSIRLWWLSGHLLGKSCSLSRSSVLLYYVCLQFYLFPTLDLRTGFWSLLTFMFYLKAVLFSKRILSI